jgi:hypothetical protein
MNLETFTKLIEGLKANHQRHLDASRLGIDLSSLQSDYDKDVVNPLMEACFGRAAMEWLDWYIYEKCFPIGDKPLQAWDGKGNEICRDIPELYCLVTSFAGSPQPAKKPKPRKKQNKT